MTLTYKFLDFIYDPTWDEPTFKKAYYFTIKKDINLFRYKHFLDPIKKAKTLLSVIRTFQTKWKMEDNKYPLYYLILPFVLASYNKNKINIKNLEKKAIHLRIMWFQDMTIENTITIQLSYIDTTTHLDLIEYKKKVYEPK